MGESLEASQLAALRSNNDNITADLRPEYLEILETAADYAPNGIGVYVFRQGDDLPAAEYVNRVVVENGGISSESATIDMRPFFAIGNNKQIVDVAVAYARNHDESSFGCELQSAGGRKYWVEAQVRVLKPLQPGDLRFMVLTRDITETHRERERMNLLSAALEQAGDFVMITDTAKTLDGDPTIAYANQSLVESTGNSLEGLIGAPWTKIFSPGNDPQIHKTINARIAHTQASFNEFLVRRADGSEFWAEFVGRPFHGSDGQDRYRIAIGRDITLRKRAANQIALLFAAIEESRDPIVIFERDSDNAIVPVYENVAAQRELKHRFMRLLDHAERGPELEHSLLDHGSTKQIFADIREDGTPAVVEFTARALHNQSSIDAAITMERTLAQGDPKAAAGYRSRLLSVSAMLPAIAEAASSHERFAILRAILLEAFGAEIETGGPGRRRQVTINAAARRASFTYSGLARTVRWSQPLEDTAVTALRFCIEAAIEHEEHNQLTQAL